MIIRFLKGMRRLNPLRPCLSPSWDLSLVLKCLQRAPFEPLESVELSALSLKTPLLTVLTSIKRVRDLQVLSVSKACLVCWPETPDWLCAQSFHYPFREPSGDPASTLAHFSNLLWAPYFWQNWDTFWMFPVLISSWISGRGILLPGLLFVVCFFSDEPV